jgi:hypothetical protein
VNRLVAIRSAPDGIHRGLATPIVCARLQLCSSDGFASALAQAGKHFCCIAHLEAAKGGLPCGRRNVLMEASHAGDKISKGPAAGNQG